MPFIEPHRRIDRVFLHCSASDDPDHDDIRTIRDWHVDGNGWSDVGYHYFIRSDGTLQEGRPLEGTPAAQAGHNAGTIAICLHGLAAENFTSAQYRALIGLAREIDRACAGGVTFHGHCEVSSKSCPVFPYRAVLGLDGTGRMTRPPDANPDPPEEPAVSADGEPETLEITSRGAAVARLQRLLGESGYVLEQDGLFGQATLAAVRAFQADNDLEADGIVGPRTRAALTPQGVGAAT